MKTTLELPDDLMRRVKVFSAQSDQKLKDTVAQLLESGLRAASAVPPDAAPPTPLRLRQPAPLSAADIDSAITAGRQ
jgi:hypothetical protein